MCRPGLPFQLRWLDLAGTHLSLHLSPHPPQEEEQQAARAAQAPRPPPPPQPQSYVGGYQSPAQNPGYPAQFHGQSQGFGQPAMHGMQVCSGSGLGPSAVWPGCGGPHDPNGTLPVH